MLSATQIWWPDERHPVHQPVQLLAAEVELDAGWEANREHGVRREHRTPLAGRIAAIDFPNVQPSYHEDKITKQPVKEFRK